jgi:hypothetical protein
VILVFDIVGCSRAEPSRGHTTPTPFIGEPEAGLGPRLALVAVEPRDLAVEPVPVGLAVELHRFVVDDLLEALPGTDRSSASISAVSRTWSTKLGPIQTTSLDAKRWPEAYCCLKGHFRSYEPLERLARE